jgi:formiminoglutamate deiminase
LARHWFTSALLPEGWAENVRLSLSDGRITAVETGVAPEPRDSRHGHALPGLSNLHSHAFQRAMAGLTEQRGPAHDNFWTWREAMYRFVDRLSPDDVEAIASHAFMEMLEAGFTRVGEFHYLHHDLAGRPYADIAEMATRIAAATVQTGIGLTLLPTFYAHGGFGGLPVANAQRRFANDLDRFARLWDSCRQLVETLPGGMAGIAPHSLRAVTPDELTRLLELAPAGPVHIHAAEQIKEVEDCRAWSGARPVEWLLANAPVDERWCLVHATQTTEAELSGIAGRGGVVGLCPITEANLGDGIFDARSYCLKGGMFGIGTDSNVLIDAATELRLLEYSQRLSTRSRNVLGRENQPSTGRVLFDAALRGGAQALGAANAELVVGQAADIITLNPTHSALLGRRGDRLLDSWIFAARDGAIDDVWRAGQNVVTGGRHVARPAIESRYRIVLEKLLAS